MSRALVRDTSCGLIDDYEQWFNGHNRLLAFRLPPAHIYATCAFPIPIGEEIPEHLKRPEVLRNMYTPPSGKLSPPAQWLVEAICSNAAVMHWARMQEHNLLYADPRRSVLFLGDAAHGMVPTLGQRATQAIEDATLAADVIAPESAHGSCDPRAWLQPISDLRCDRMRFAMQSPSRPLTRYWPAPIRWQEPCRRRARTSWRSCIVCTVVRRKSAVSQVITKYRIEVRTHGDEAAFRRFTGSSTLPSNRPTLRRQRRPCWTWWCGPITSSWVLLAGVARSVRMPEAIGKPFARH